MQGNKTQSYAPFGSVSRKKQKKKKNAEEPPGPGSYDIELPIIAPIVQTIRKNNNNIIVKLGHLGTSSFLGNESRFNQKTDNNLGPGQYSPKYQRDQSKQHSPKLIRKSAAIKLQQLIKAPHTQRHPTISEVKRIDFEDDFQMPNKLNLIKNRGKQYHQKGGSIWSKLTECRISPDSKLPDNLGPGSYHITNARKDKSLIKQPSSSFVSNSVRSFFDQIRFETNHDDKARKRQQRNYKSDLVGPGSYEINSARKRSLNLYQFFGSTEQRL